MTVELYNDKPLSVKVPKHVTCVVKEAQTPVRGTAQAPKYVFNVKYYCLFRLHITTCFLFQYLYLWKLVHCE